MKTKICTSIEQSNKLIELGIDVNTADFHWFNGVIMLLFDKVAKEQYDKTNHEYVPAWSLSALLELMPPCLFEWERGIDLNIYRSLNGKRWHCSYMPNNIESMKTDKFKQITHGDNLVDAAFEMIVWLKENKKL